MLLINGTPVAVELPQPIARQRRLQKVGCNKPPPPGCHNFVHRFGPKPRPPQPPRPAPAMERKWRESRLRLELKRQRLIVSNANRVTAATQCALPPAEPATRTQVVQTAAQTDQTKDHLLSLGELDKLTMKIGQDASTQVAECDLDDVEAQLQLLAEQLVAATLEPAAVDVLNRDHVAALRREQIAFERKQLAEQVELDRLVHAENLRRERGMRALAKMERVDTELAYRAVHSRALAEHYMAGLCADAFGRLESADYLQGENQLAAWLRDQFLGHDRPRTGVPMNALISDVIANRPQVHRRREDGVRTEDGYVMLLQQS